jgi:hypothetical protein
MFVSLFCGITIEAVILITVIKFEPLRPLCELLLAPGWHFVTPSMFALVFGLAVNAVLYSIPFEIVRRVVRAQRAKGRDDC